MEQQENLCTMGKIRMYRLTWSLNRRGGAGMEKTGANPDAGGNAGDAAQGTKISFVSKTSASGKG